MKILTDNEIQLLPLIEIPTQIQVCSEYDQLDELLDHFLQAPCIGFDTEKRPSFVKGKIYPISLVQISTDHKTLIIQVQHTGYHPKLWNILENQNILKIGIALRDDFKDLSSIRPITPKGIVNLDAMAKGKGLKKSGLKFLAAQFLRARISKKMQTSNWANVELTQAQIKYAAIDAWACVAIYPELLGWEGIIGNP